MKWLIIRGWPRVLSNSILNRVLKYAPKWMIPFQWTCLRQSSTGTASHQYRNGPAWYPYWARRGPNAISSVVTCKSAWHNWQAVWKYSGHEESKWSEWVWDTAWQAAGSGYNPGSFPQCSKGLHHIMSWGSLQQAHHPQLLAGKNCNVFLQFTGISNICAFSQCRYQTAIQDGIISHNFCCIFSIQWSTLSW